MAYLSVCVALGSIHRTVHVNMFPLKCGCDFSSVFYFNVTIFAISHKISQMKGTDVLKLSSMRITKIPAKLLESSNCNMKRAKVIAESMRLANKQPENNLTDKAHPLEPKCLNDALTEATDLGFPVVRLHDIYSKSFQWLFRQSVNKQADKLNTQRQVMGMQGRRGGNGVQKCLGVNGR